MRRILGHRGGRAFFFLLSFLALCWPFMANTLYGVVEEQYLHLMIAWCLIIVFLYILSRSSLQNEENSGG